MKILFVSHDASQTGAPILLLHLAAALKADNKQVDFLLRHGGTIENKFRDLGKTYYFYKNGTSLMARARRKIFGQGHHDLSGLDWNSYALVLSNTITNGDILPHIRKFYKGPVVTYVHELQMAADFFTRPELVQQLMEHTDRYATPCLTVKDFLVTRYGIDEDKISILPYYIPEGAATGAQGLVQQHKGLRVGAAGTVDWRKSPDLFVQTAALVFAKQPGADIRFVWKGAPDGGMDLKRVLYDVEKAGLKDRVEFLPASSEMKAFYQSLDIFLLTSREDPYPLVVLEAAAAEVPTVCFKAAGGAPEFVEGAHGGISVGYLDTMAMADALLHYYQHPAEREEAGRNARQRLTDTHQNIHYIIDHFESIVKATVNHAL